MAPYNASDFAAEVDDYYEAKAPYTKLMHSIGEQSNENTTVSDDEDSPESQHNAFEDPFFKAPGAQKSTAASEDFGALLRELEEIQTQSNMEKVNNKKGTESKA